jgi:hypothetical protein
MVQRKDEDGEEKMCLVVMIRIDDEGMRAGITGGADRDGVLRVVGAMELLKAQLLARVKGDIDE